MPQPQQRRKSSNISNINATDDLQLAISKMLPNVVDLKPPQVRNKTLTISIKSALTPTTHNYHI
jgi:hypothetical protein